MDGYINGWTNEDMEEWNNGWMVTEINVILMAGLIMMTYPPSNVISF